MQERFVSRFFAIGASAKIVALVLALAGSPAYAAPAPIGNWLTEDKTGVIAIAPCGSSLCGRIVGMSDPLDAKGAPQRDVHGAPMCDLAILNAGEDSTPGYYSGHIIDPSEGSVWHCVFWVDAAGNLNLRGYVLVPLLGKTQVWSRFSGKLSDDCRLGK